MSKKKKAHVNFRNHTIPIDIALAIMVIAPWAVKHKVTVTIVGEDGRADVESKVTRKGKEV